MLRSLDSAAPYRGPRREVLYGRRKMTRWLPRNGFPDIGKRAVDRLMHIEGMCVRGHPRYADPNHDLSHGRRREVRSLAADLLKRNFSTNAPNRAGSTTCPPTWRRGAALPASPSRSICSLEASWAGRFATVRDVAFVDACLKMALWRRDRAGDLIKGISVLTTGRRMSLTPTVHLK